MAHRQGDDETRPLLLSQNVSPTGTLVALEQSDATLLPIVISTGPPSRGPALRRKMSSAFLPSDPPPSTKSMVLPAAIAAAVFSALWFIDPPQGLTHTSFHLLAVFATTISLLLTSSLPISFLVLSALLFLTATQSFACALPTPINVNGTLIRYVECSRCGTDYQCDGAKGAFQVMLNGFAQPISWLVLAAFHLGRAVELSRLGERVSLYLVRWLGGTLLGMGYAVYLAELVLAPFVPSNTARGGGIIFPIVTSLITTLENSGGSPAAAQFLTLCGGHANLLISSLFMTATIANPLISDKAEETFGIDFGFEQWALGAIPPGVVSILIIPPLLLFFTRRVLNSDEVDSTPFESSRVRDEAEESLRLLGGIKRREIEVIVVLAGCLVLWVLGDWTGLSETFIALGAVAVLVALGTISWEDVVHNATAWDSMFWLSGMIVMADQLSLLGLSSWFGTSCARMLVDQDFSVWSSTLLLALLYLISMYMFSSLTGHIIALSGPFMDAARSIGSPPFLITALLAYFSAISGSLTNYSTGALVMYYALGHVGRINWFVVGLLVVFVEVCVYFTVGVGWWWILGWTAPLLQ